MRDLPEWVRVALVAELAFSVVAAAVGRAPREPVHWFWRRLLVIGAVCSGVCAAVARAQHVPIAEKLLLFLAVELLCAWAWTRRAGRPDDGGEDDGGGGGGPHAPENPPPEVDWDAFDRARRGWSRPRTRF